MGDNLFDKLDGIDRKIDILLDETEEDDVFLPKDIIAKELLKEKNGFLLQNFAKKALKSYVYGGTESSMKAQKKPVLLKLGLLFLLGVLTSVIASLAAGLYTTYTFFENIWMCFVLSAFFHVVRAKKKYPDFEYARHSVYKFRKNEEGTYIEARIKISYVIFLLLSALSSVLNVVYIFFDGKNIVFLSVLATVLEALFLTGCFLCLKSCINFFGGYRAIYFEGFVLGRPEPVTLVYDLHENLIYTEGEYEKTGRS